MSQSIFTLNLPVSPGGQELLQTTLASLDYTGLTPQNDPLGFQSIEMLHYASMFLYDDPEDGWSLVFENNIDGDIRAYIKTFVDTAINKDQGQLVLSLFQHCVGFEQGKIEQLATYLQNYIQLPSAGYSGCVGRSRNQILFESEVHQLASDTLSQLPANTDAASAARAVHDALASDSRFKDIADIPKGTPKGKKLLDAQSLANNPATSSALRGGLIFVGRVLSALTIALFRSGPWPVLKALFAVLVFVAMGIWNQLRKEPSAPEDTWRPDPAHVRTQRVFEDFAPTNHMTSIVHLHTDSSRRWAKWAAFVLLETLARYKFVYGSLGAIPSIHFAHWGMANNKRRLIFVSNFDGNWDSYLDDFTLKAAKGLTLAWAHGKGLPVSFFMVGGGAARGPAFIDWARRSMVPTLVWYNAYPHLSIRNINLNTALRQAIVNDRNKDNAGNWLELVQ